MVECLHDTQKVGGSIPPGRTKEKYRTHTQKVGPDVRMKVGRIKITILIFYEHN